MVCRVSEMKRYALPVVGLFLFGVMLPGTAQTASDSQAKVLSVRQVRHADFRNSRYPSTPQYTMDLALQFNGQTYCTGYVTPVLDEVQDLLATNGKNVQVSMQGKKVVLALPNGRHIHADLVKSTQC
jgi:hypothetical protein